MPPRRPTKKAQQSKPSMAKVQAQTAPQRKEKAVVLTDSQVRDIVAEVHENPEGKIDYALEVLGEVQTRLNPYGRYSDTRPDDTRCVVATITNIAHENDLALALVTAEGFYSRAAKEYNPVYPGKKEYLAKRNLLIAEYDRLTDYIAEKVKTPEDMFASIKAKNEAEQARQQLDADYEKTVNEYTAHARTIVGDFLASLQKFDPDRHVFKGVRGEKDITGNVVAFNDEFGNPLPEPKVTSYDDQLQEVRNRMSTGKKARLYQNNKSVDARFCEYLRDLTGTIYNDSAVIVENCNTIVRQLYMLEAVAGSSPNLLARDIIGNISDVAQISMRAKKAIADNNAKFYEYAVKPFQAEDAYEQLSNNPPLELKHGMKRYLESHYVQLRNCAQAKYGANFVIDNVVQIFGNFGSPELARQYINKHSSELRTAPSIFMVGQPTLIGPFKGNLDQTQFVDKNSEIVRNMMNRMNADEKLSADIMRKVVKNQKAENTLLEGPDSVLLAELDSLHSRTNDLSTPERVLTPEERHEINQKRNRIDNINKIRDINEKIKVLELIADEDLTFAQRSQLGTLRDDRQTLIDLESIPENAIGTYTYQVDSEGKMQRSLIYTQEEKPDHLTEGSEYAEKYQPIHGEKPEITLDLTDL